MVLTHHSLFKIMIVENLHIKLLKCKYLEKCAHVLHDIILLHNIYLFDTYVHETHTVGIFTILYI